MNRRKCSNSEQTAYLRRYTLTDGRQAGVRIVEIYNGVLRALFNESKALDLIQLFHLGVNMGFLSKNGISASSGAFSGRFEGGMVYTCGLDSLGAREGYELHGTLHNTPARITSCLCDGETIRVTAEMENTELFGKNLLLRRTVSTTAGSGSIAIHDELVNRGFRAEPYCLLYHVNLGYPMLDEGVTIEADSSSVLPRTPWAKEKMAGRTVFPPPTDNEEECCYFLKNRTPQVRVVNRALGRAFILSYSGDTLPYMVQWNSAASGDYALGLEPATTFLDDLFTYRTLDPGQKVAFSVTLRVDPIA